MNDAEGITIDYNAGRCTVATTDTYTKPAPSDNTDNQSDVGGSTAQETTDGGWTTAPAGQVYVSEINKYYTSVVNPGNYQGMSIDQAQAQGATQGHPNMYAR